MIVDLGEGFLFRSAIARTRLRVQEAITVGLEFDLAVVREFVDDIDFALQQLLEHASIFGSIH